MKKTILLPALLIVLLAILAVTRSPAYQLTFVPSAGEASNVVLQYNAGYQFTNYVGTNGVSTNGWIPFGFCYPGTTNIPIPSTVPSPSYLAISVEGTNYVSGVYTNAVLYNTNTLAGTLTNNVKLPPPAAGPAGFAN